MMSLYETTPFPRVDHEVMSMFDGVSFPQLHGHLAAIRSGRAGYGGTRPTLPA